MKSATIVRIAPHDAKQLHQECLQLAEMARTGEINGLAFTAFHPDGKTSEGLIGRARIDLYRAYYAVHRLAKAILALLR